MGHTLIMFDYVSMLLTIFYQKYSLVSMFTALFKPTKYAYVLT